MADGSAQKFITRDKNGQVVVGSPFKMKDMQDHKDYAELKFYLDQLPKPERRKYLKDQINQAPPFMDKQRLSRQVDNAEKLEQEHDKLLAMEKSSENYFTRVKEEHKLSMHNYREEIRAIRINEYIKNYKPGDFYDQDLPRKRFSGTDMKAALLLDMPDKFMIEQLKLLQVDYINRDLHKKPSLASLASNESENLSADEKKGAEKNQEQIAKKQASKSKSSINVNTNIKSRNSLKDQASVPEIQRGGTQALYIGSQSIDGPKKPEKFNQEAFRSARRKSSAKADFDPMRKQDITKLRCIQFRQNDLGDVKEVSSMLKDPSTLTLDAGHISSTSVKNSIVSTEQRQRSKSILGFRQSDFSQMRQRQNNHSHLAGQNVTIQEAVYIGSSSKTRNRKDQSPYMSRVSSQDFDLFQAKVSGGKVQVLSPENKQNNQIVKNQYSIPTQESEVEYDPKPRGQDNLQVAQIKASQEGGKLLETKLPKILTKQSRSSNVRASMTYMNAKTQNLLEQRLINKEKNRENQAQEARHSSVGKYQERNVVLKDLTSEELRGILPPVQSVQNRKNSEFIQPPMRFQVARRYNNSGGGFEPTSQEMMIRKAIRIKHQII